MLLLDYLNHIVAHSMAHKHGGLILLILNVLHGSVRMLEIFLSSLTQPIHLGYRAILLNQSHIHYQLQLRTSRFMSSMCNISNLFITACVKCAVNNAISPFGHNIAYFRNNY